MKNQDAQIRFHSQPLPKLLDINTFRDELIQALDDPEIQKTAISGLIQEIVVHLTAALDIQCSLSNLVSDYSATVYHHGNGFIQR